MNKHTSFLSWLWATQKGRIVFIHLFLVAAASSMATLGADTLAWTIAAWVLVVGAPLGYWIGNYWYWTVRLNRGAKC